MVLTMLSLRLLVPIAPTKQRSQWLSSVSLRVLALGLLLVTGCGPGGDSGVDSFTSAPPDQSSGRVSVSLAWDAVQDPSVNGYFVYYGTRSTNSFGSCAYTTRLFTPAPAARVNGLSPGTQYFFAVSAFNGLESPCSAEVSTVTQTV